MKRPRRARRRYSSSVSPVAAGEAQFGGALGEHAVGREDLFPRLAGAAQEPASPPHGSDQREEHAERRSAARGGPAVRDRITRPVGGRSDRRGQRVARAPAGRSRFMRCRSRGVAAASPSVPLARRPPGVVARACSCRRGSSIGRVRGTGPRRRVSDPGGGLELEPAVALEEDLDPRVRVVALGPGTARRPGACRPGSRRRPVPAGRARGPAPPSPSRTAGRSPIFDVGQEIQQGARIVALWGWWCRRRTCRP